MKIHAIKVQKNVQNYIHIEKYFYYSQQTQNVITI